MIEPASPVGRVIDGPTFLFDRSALERLLERVRDDYARAQPFPHVVLDDFLPPDAATQLVREFPPLDTFISDPTEGGNKIGKFNSTAHTPMGAFTRGVLAQLGCAPFLDFLERLSGVTGLVPDPHGIDGALRHFVRGAQFAVHADFNTKWRLGLERRLNIILYLNEDWPAEYGGALELWDRDMVGCVARIAPVFNRAIVFSVESDAHHGFPDPLRCPEGESRKSLQLYYYAVPRPEVAPHLTLWRRRPPTSLMRRLRRRIGGR
jgi:hypothetical protein